MQKLLRFQQVVANILGLLVVLLMLLIVIDVGGRFLFNAPLQGGIEISQVLMTWLLCLPLAYALIRGIHVRVTILERYLPRHIETLGNILSLLFFCLITYASWVKFWHSFSTGELMAATIWLPLWLQKLALPIGFSLFSLQLFYTVLVQIGKLGRD